MKIIDIAFDNRIHGYCATAVCSYRWFIEATRGSEANLEIQRKIIGGSKAYQTLRADLKRGCIVPPIVLAVSHLDLPSDLDALEPLAVVKDPEFRAKLEAQLLAPKPEFTYIIDGLQRTNAIRQTLDELIEGGESKGRFLDHPLRVELWLNISFGAIAYRMLLLNAGQKPMSIKRQVEVLSIQLKDDLESMPGISITTTTSGQRRSKPGQFSLANLSQSFQAWLQGTPNIDLRNTIMEQLVAESAIETLGKSLTGNDLDEDFKSLVEWLVKVDQRIFNLDSHFLSNDTVLLGLSAAVGSSQRNEKLQNRVKPSLDGLLRDLEEGKEDPLGIELFNQLRSGVDIRKVNVGQFSRDMVFRAFQEFFISNGSKRMHDCWAFGASQF